MTLLTICTNVADDVGVVAPASILSNNETTAKRLLRATLRTGRHIARRPDGGWNVMIKEHTFTTSASGAAYPLPSDYKYLLGATAWDRTNFWQMRGGLSAGEWQAQKSSIIASSGRIRKTFRIKPTGVGTELFNIDPVPTSADDLVYDYMSTSWIISSGALVNDFALDADTIVFDEDLVEMGVKWRFLNSMGLAYFEAKAEYYDALEIEIARAGGSGQSFVLGGGEIDPTLLAQTPESGFG